MSNRDSISQVPVLTEIFKWDRKFFRVYTDFRPNLKVSKVTPKFYARHEGSESLDSVDPETLELILNHCDKGPREKQKYPETENQRYGWYQELLVPMDKMDRRLNNHRIGSQDIQVAAEIKKNLVKEAPFTGVPFKL
ncbi:protein FAM183B-like [Macrosteles quadrilineatus]|uniref:protein FAM183B-like n=1 Tax=Macrosteles quadrilineatus TaxID=74068 RepID=UPI0023E0BA7A|nr:protein FAM183B-like [Macrosteles quadrilineatus]